MAAHTLLVMLFWHGCAWVRLVHVCWHGCARVRCCHCVGACGCAARVDAQGCMMHIRAAQCCVPHAEAAFADDAR
eukprot:11286905-Alexandrium_andersonii.AAC.1